MSVKDDQVQLILNNIKKTHNIEEFSEHEKANDVPHSKPKKLIEKPNAVVRGVPKSGRFWKEPREKFSTINKTKGLKQSFDKKTALRLELKRTKELSRQLQEELKEKELARKERRRENIKRTEENRKKSELVQTITNTTKLKRMKKKQLRFIEKRDTNRVEAKGK